MSSVGGETMKFGVDFYHDESKASPLVVLVRHVRENSIEHVAADSRSRRKITMTSLSVA